MHYNEDLINPDSLNEEIEVKFFMAVSKLLILCQKIENSMKFFPIRADLLKGKDVNNVKKEDYTMGSFSEPYVALIKDQKKNCTENINLVQQKLKTYPSDQKFIFETENGQIIKTREDIIDILDNEKKKKKMYSKVTNTIGVTVKFRNKLSHELMKNYSFVISDPLYSISTILDFIERETKWLHKHAKYVFECEGLISNLLIANNSNGELHYRYPEKQKEKMKIWVFHDLDECIATYREEN